MEEAKKSENTYNDLPREVITRLAEDMVLKMGGPEVTQVFFKFTCDMCLTRCFLLKPNSLPEYGECAECGHHTKLDRAGFALAFKVSALKKEEKES